MANMNVLSGVTVSSSDFKVYEILDDSFYDLFNGKYNFHGRDDRWLTKKINELENLNILTIDQQEELESARVEMGMTNEGNKKPPVCWDYVNNNGCCKHTKFRQAKGFIKSNRWHPGTEELQYLKNKKK